MSNERPKNQDTEEQQSDTEKIHEAARASLDDTEDVEVMRRRLYARGEKTESFGRTDLSKVKETVEPQSKVTEPQHDIKQSTEHAPAVDVSVARQTPYENRVVAEAPLSQTMRPVKKRKKYRGRVLVVGLAFFMFALLFSIFLFMWGNTPISGDNISIELSNDQFTIGGGEELAFQASVANLNTVPIESATLIVNYPAGTQSADNPGQELFSERLQLNVVDPNEVVNVPIKAIIFGEENAEKVVNVAIEYRVRGSNATFYKDAEPLRLKISSSPVTILVESVERISSGQEIEFDITVRSNSPTPLSDILVKASYPFGFDFTESDIETASGQDTWLVESIEPEEEVVITIRGIVTGRAGEERAFVFSVGVPSERDRYNLASTFSKHTARVAMEEPFLGIDVSVNGSSAEAVAIDSSDIAQVRVKLTNSQEDTIYDGVVTAKLEGDALNEIDVQVPNGYYDSTNNIVRWDSVDVKDLKEINPGQSSQVQLTLTPEKNIARTPEITMIVTVEARRVYADGVPQTITGSVSRAIRIESATKITSSALYSMGPYTNTGPTPPVAEELTQYTFYLVAQNGSNDITSTIMTAVLPQYVTWLDLKTEGDDITYDSYTRTITWNIGDMDANAREEVWAQVSFVPSLSQVGLTPTLLETQRLRATDRFTGTVIRATAPALTTSLRDDPDRSTHKGEVQED